MRALLLTLLACASSAPLVRARAVEDVAVTFTCTPDEVEIGQPVACVLRVEHPQGARVSLIDDEAGPLFADPQGSAHAVPWAVIDGPTRRVTALAGEDRLATELTWTALALEPGTRSPGVARVEVELDDRVVSRSARAADLVVRGALADGEDAPRPLSAFPEAPAPLASGGARGILIAVAAWALCVAVLCVVALVAFVRSLCRPPAAVAASLDERLAELERGLVQGHERGGEALEQGVRAFTYGASALLREAVDRRLGAPAPGATDGEWLARLERDPRVEPGLAADLRGFFAALEPIEYGALRPTRFAFEELARRARAIGARVTAEVGTAPDDRAPHDARERAA